MSVKLWEGGGKVVTGEQSSNNWAEIPSPGGGPGKQMFGVTVMVMVEPSPTKLQYPSNPVKRNGLQVILLNGVGSQKLAFGSQLVVWGGVHA